jgi:hypothetical protein
MKIAVRLLGVAVIMASGFATAQAVADEANPGASGKPGISANSLSPAALSHDPLVQRSQSDDLSSRVDALEASRAAVDRKTKSPISLSISGWVDEQVIYTRH